MACLFPDADTFENTSLTFIVQENKLILSDKVVCNTLRHTQQNRPPAQLSAQPPSSQRKPTFLSCHLNSNSSCPHLSAFYVH